MPKPVLQQLETAQLERCCLGSSLFCVSKLHRLGSLEESVKLSMILKDFQTDRIWTGHIIHLVQIGLGIGEDVLCMSFHKK